MLQDSDYYNNSLIFRPKDKINFSTGFTIKSINFLINYIIVGKQFSDKTNTNSISKYNLLDTSLSYSLKIHKINIDFSLKVKNLLNEDYIVMKDYPLPGREVLLSFGIDY